jgi:hypothetical protein
MGSFSNDRDHNGIEVTVAISSSRQFLLSFIARVLTEWPKVALIESCRGGFDKCGPHGAVSTCDDECFRHASRAAEPYLMFPQINGRAFRSVN